VDEALTYNQDLALAAARVDEARALLRIADAERLPAWTPRRSVTAPAPPRFVDAAAAHGTAGT